MSTRIPRRNAVTGTVPDLDALSAAHPKLKTRNSYHAADSGLKCKYQVHQAEAARRLFLGRRWEQCREVCLGIISGKTTDMVMARACMMLSKQEMDDEPRMRAEYAEQAIVALERVIEGTSESRFPVDQAQALLDEAQRLLEDAELDSYSSDDEMDTLEDGQNSQGPQNRSVSGSSVVTVILTPATEQGEDGEMTL